MHHTLSVVVEILAAGAVLTVIGIWLIERTHPPRGRFIEVGGLCQHVVELRGVPSDPASAPPIVLIHGAGCNLEDMRWRTPREAPLRHSDRPAGSRL